MSSHINPTFRDPNSPAPRFADNVSEKILDAIFELVSNTDLGEDYMDKLSHINMAREVRGQRELLEKQIADLRIIEAFHLRMAGVSVDNEAASVISNLAGPVASDQDIAQEENVGSEDFESKSYAEAIEKILRTAGHPMLAKEIVGLLRAGGKGAGMKEISVYNSTMSALSRFKHKFTRYQGRWMLVDDMRGLGSRAKKKVEEDAPVSTQ